MLVSGLFGVVAFCLAELMESFFGFAAVLLVPMSVLFSFVAF